MYFDVYKLLYMMKRDGVKTGDMCAALGITKSTWSKKINGASDFTLSQMWKIADVLGLENPGDIFFARNVS